jgi:hypothetical protein
MECPPSPDPHSDRIARAAARVNAAMTRVSQAEELVTIAKERLALARLALEEARVRDTHHLPPDVDPMRPEESR